MSYAAEHLNALPPGTRVDDFELEKDLRSGGFGITYLGKDLVLGRTVAVKEYLPAGVAVRVADMTVHPRTRDDEEDYRKGLDDFLHEARALSRFEHHPNIVRVHRFFEAHGTAYIVMEYVEGQALSELLKAEETLDEPRLTALLNPLLAALSEMHTHAEEILHRDIKPGNIMLRDDGSPVLIDFGSARAAMGARTQNLTAVVSPGYAPMEQYHAGRQGPWTDIYAVGAVLYTAMTGAKPSDAPKRADGDDLVPTGQATAGRYGKPLCDAVDWALRKHRADRPQSIAEWREVLEGRSAPPPPSAGALPPPRTAETPALTPPGHPASPPVADRSSGGKGWGRWLAALGVAVVLAAGGAYYWWYGPTLPWDGQSSSDRNVRGEPQARVSALRETCNEHHEEERYAQAVSCYREVLALEPEDAEAQRGERQALSALRETCKGHFEKEWYAQAVSCYREVRGLEPEDAEAQRRELKPGDVKALRMKCYEEEVLAHNKAPALECYHDVLKLKPGDMRTLISMCMAQQVLRDYTPALECYREVLKLDPEHARALEGVRELQSKVNTE